MFWSTGPCTGTMPRASPWGLQSPLDPWLQTRVPQPCPAHSALPGSRRGSGAELGAGSQCVSREKQQCRSHTKPCAACRGSQSSSHLSFLRAAHGTVPALQGHVCRGNAAGPRVRGWDAPHSTENTHIICVWCSWEDDEYPHCAQAHTRFNRNSKSPRLSLQGDFIFQLTHPIASQMKAINPISTRIPSLYFSFKRKVELPRYPVPALPEAGREMRGIGARGRRQEPSPGNL